MLPEDWTQEKEDAELAEQRRVADHTLQFALVDPTSVARLFAPVVEISEEFTYDVSDRKEQVLWEQIYLGVDPPDWYATLQEREPVMESFCHAADADWSRYWSMVGSREALADDSRSPRQRLADMGWGS